MVIDRSILPEEPEELKDLVMNVVDKYNEDVDTLKEKIALLQHQLFGRKSEKLGKDNPDQLSLFDSSDESEKEESQSEDEGEEDITIAAHKRKRGGRNPFPDHLERVEILVDIDEKDKICGCGCQMQVMNVETSEKLDIIPEQLRVLVYNRPMYSCKNCEGSEDDGPTVKIAPPIPQILPKAIASDVLIAYILSSKFVEAMPFYRQEQNFKRRGVNISRANMSHWAMTVATACRGIYNLIRDHVLESDIINADETRHKVLEEMKRQREDGKTVQWCQMWVFLRNNGTYPAVYYQYEDSRGKKVPIDFFSDYQGFVQTDSFGSYSFLDNIERIIHLHCWAHARREFIKVINAATSKKKKKKNRKKPKNKSGNAQEALKKIKLIYKIEKECKEAGLIPEEIYKVRQEKTKPLLEEFKEWLDRKTKAAPPGSHLGKAINYCINHWEGLTNFLKDGRLHPDNNSVERAIRPFVIGRKNWLFSQTVEGAEASAIMYSLTETAKANGLDPFSYFQYIFSKLPTVKTVEEMETLLPWNLTGSDLTKIQLPNNVKPITLS